MKPLLPRKSLPILALVAMCCGCSGLESAAHRPPPGSDLRPIAAATATAPDVSSGVRLVAYDDAELASPPDREDPLPVPQDSTAAEDGLQVHTLAPNTTAPDPASPGLGSDFIQLDLTEALAIATNQNPRIAFASARYREAYAQLRFARTLWLPAIRAGVSYNHHEGPLQASDGQVLDVSRSAMQGGLGLGAVGAGSPMVAGVAAQYRTADVWFQPKIADHTLCARQAATEATTNDTMLATALAYLDLLSAKQQLRIAEETCGHAQNLAELTSTFAATGQGPQADADRTQTELAQRQVELARSQEATRVAAARLMQMLSMDATTDVEPREPTVVPIDLVQLDTPVNELVAIGLSQRPELAEAQYLVCEAVYRYRREKYAPLLPSVILGISQSAYGGGTGGDIQDGDGRLDFDAAVFWELRNFGFGERARRQETRSQYDQARALQVSMMDQVAREVIEAQTQVTSRRHQIEVAESAVASATDSYQRNLSRVREGQGLPIEVLQSLQALDAARRDYLRTLTDYNEAQFRLQRALGWPVS